MYSVTQLQNFCLVLFRVSISLVNIPSVHSFYSWAHWTFFMNFLILHRVVSWQLFWILYQITIFCEFIHFFVGYCDTLLIHVFNKLFVFWCTWNTKHLSSLERGDLFLFFHLIKISCLVMSDSLRPHGLYLTRLLYPWNSPDKKYWRG